MLTLTLLLALGVSSAIGGEIKLTPCVTGGPPADKADGIVIESLDIEGCTAQPCTGKKGKSYSVNTKAKILFATKKFHVKLIGMVKPTMDEITIYEDLDVCKEFGEKDKTCDNIKPNLVIEKKRTWAVDKKWPTGEGTLRIIVSDDKKEVQYCGELSAKIED